MRIYVEHFRASQLNLRNSDHNMRSIVTLTTPSGTQFEVPADGTGETVEVTPAGISDYSVHKIGEFVVVVDSATFVRTPTRQLPVEYACGPVHSISRRNLKNITLVINHTTDDFYIETDERDFDVVKPALIRLLSAPDFRK